MMRNNLFYSDSPIESSKEDKLGRHSFAKILAKAILNLDNKDTFTVGLYGRWGSGKTSLVNMLLNEIEEQQKNINKKNKLIIIHFEPWNFSNTDQLLSQFFVHLANEFQSKKEEHFNKIGEALVNYSDLLGYTKEIPYIGKVLSAFGKEGIQAIGKGLQNKLDTEDIQKQKQRVIDLLKRQSQHILIIIDDIDRLNNEQIRQIFQLITSVAKFPNTMYLVVFDKDIVVKALKEVQMGDGEDYLEKIIQFPVQIPNIRRNKLRAVLLSQLNSIIEETEVSFHQEHWQLLFETCIIKMIENIRDINRLCNLVQFKLSAIGSEVDFADMVTISIIEISMPQVYEWIKSNKVVLTGDLDLLHSGAEKSPKEWRDFYTTEIGDLLGFKNGWERKLDSDFVIEVLSWLFPPFARKIGENYEVFDIGELRRTNQIAHPEKFDRYFELDLDEIMFKKSEIQNAIYSMSYEAFGNYLLKCDESGNSYDLLEETKAMISEISQDRIKVIAMSLLATGAQLDMVSNKTLLSVSARTNVNFIIMDLIDRMNSEERCSFLSNIIKKADFIILQSVAEIINMIELGYGRLAANGKARNYKKVVSLDELVQLEEEFTQRLKDLIEGQNQNLLESGYWMRSFYLLECFDSAYARKYILNLLEEERNVALYLDSSINVWVGGGTTYEILDSYKKYLTEKQILGAIKILIDSGQLFSLSVQIQNKCTAFFLNATGGEKRYGRIEQFNVDALLEEWKKAKK
jgi:Cdc6-like AAA superfamily ATPase